MRPPFIVTAACPAGVVLALRAVGNCYTLAPKDIATHFATREEASVAIGSMPWAFTHCGVRFSIEAAVHQLRTGA
jgi:hypothetical protein